MEGLGGVVMVGWIVEVAVGNIVGSIATELGAAFVRGALAQSPDVRRLGSREARVPADHLVVRSDIPGRLRVGVAGLRGRPARVRALEARLLATPAVRRARGSSRTGSVLIEFDESAMTRLAIWLALEDLPAPASTGA